MKIFKSMLLIVIMVMTFESCKEEKQIKNYWETSEAWFQTGTEINENFVDAFYIVSTNVMQSFDSVGNECYQAVLNERERASIKSEMEGVQRLLFPDSVNYYSPYYHQFTMNSISLSKDEFRSVYGNVKNEVVEAFDYYMENFNNGRRFVIAGFSQGAMMTKEIVKHLDDEQYSRLVAAYVIGDGLSEDDLKCENVVPAISAFGTGVTISFNTVRSLDGIWQPVYENATVCINPINWTTDMTPADFTFGEQNLTATIDTTYNVIVIPDFESSDGSTSTIWPENCLHRYDILFYNNSLKKNVLDRAYRR